MFKPEIPSLRTIAVSSAIAFFLLLGSNNPIAASGPDAGVPVPLDPQNEAYWANADLEQMLKECKPGGSVQREILLSPGEERKIAGRNLGLIVTDVPARGIDVTDIWTGWVYPKGYPRNYGDFTRVDMGRSYLAQDSKTGEWGWVNFKADASKLTADPKAQTMVRMETSCEVVVYPWMR